MAQHKVIILRLLWFGNCYSCIAAVIWDAYDMEDTTGKARRSHPGLPITDAKLFFHPVTGLKYSIGIMFRSAYRDPSCKYPTSREPSQPALSYEHIENFTKDLEVRADLGNRASPVNQVHAKRTLTGLLILHI